MSIAESFLVVLALTGNALAHVALRFPQAKYPAYDFLDNTRTGPPCGVRDEANSVRTTLTAGQQYTFTFHLAYPHNGAFCYSILNKDGEVVRQLTNGFVQGDVSTSQEYTVTLPANFTCDDCSIQLIRQALEWNGPPSYTGVYLFWSCANVNITAAPVDSCDGTQCTGHGTCVNGTCNCMGTWYGQYCQYQDGCLSDSDCSGHGSCISLDSTAPPRKECFCNAGWQGLNCETESPLTTASFDTADYDGYLRARDNLEYWFTQKNDYIEVAIKYTGSEWVGFGFRPNSLNQDCWQEAPGYLPATAKGSTDVQPWDGAAKGESWGTAIGSSSEEEGEEEGGGLHAMDCTDIVIARVKGNQYRILDFYTRDRSTPQVDDWYGGSQNLTGAIGATVDGVTWIRWRKPIRSTDKFDHDIQDATMHIIWAHAQVIGSYDPVIPGADANPVDPNLNVDFYKPLEIKYHGANNRGVTANNFVNPFMTTCSYSTGDYSAKWGIPSDDATVLAVEITLANGGEKWAGIGFSSDNMMPMSDIITGAEALGVQDRYATAKAKPGVDSDQTQITASAVTTNGGNLVVQFKRKLTSADSNDVSINTPRFLLFAWGDVSSGDISYHGATNRQPTSAPVNVNSCSLDLQISSAHKSAVSLLLLFVASLSVLLFY